MSRPVIAAWGPTHQPCSTRHSPVLWTSFKLINLIYFPQVCELAVNRMQPGISVFNWVSFLQPKYCLVILSTECAHITLFHICKRDTYTLTNLSNQLMVLWFTASQIFDSYSSGRPPAHWSFVRLSKGDVWGWRKAKAGWCKSVSLRDRWHVGGDSQAKHTLRISSISYSVTSVKGERRTNKGR